MWSFTLHIFNSIYDCTNKKNSFHTYIFNQNSKSQSAHKIGDHALSVKIPILFIIWSYMKTKEFLGCLSLTLYVVFFALKGLVASYPESTDLQPGPANLKWFTTKFMVYLEDLQDMHMVCDLIIVMNYTIANYIIWLFACIWYLLICLRVKLTHVSWLVLLKE